MAKARPITGLDAHAPVARNARLVAKTRLEELYDWERYVDNPYNISELHNLRIAAKRVQNADDGGVGSENAQANRCDDGYEEHDGHE